MRPGDPSRKPPAFAPGVSFLRLRPLPRESDTSPMYEEDDYRNRRYAGPTMALRQGEREARIRFHVRFERVKALVLAYADTITVSGSEEERIHWCRQYLERKLKETLRQNRTLAALKWEVYGHIRFLFCDDSPDDFRAAAHAYTNSIRLNPTQVRPKVYFGKVAQELRKIEARCSRFPFSL
ncbi:MAG: hypothetical protein KF876_12940 [Nitrospira sp.]|nr:hypothetical protein [Nitrospira sp.]